MSEAGSLWPSDLLAPCPLRSPEQILKDQAGGLDERTNGVLQGVVVSSPRPHGGSWHTLFARRAVTGEEIEILAVNCPFDGYPARLWQEGTSFFAATESAFLEITARVLASVCTRRRVHALLGEGQGQATEARSPGEPRKTDRST